MNHIGNAIKERRSQLGINQQTLADLSDISINTLVAIERGTGNPSVQILSRVLDVLGLQLQVRLKE